MTSNTGQQTTPCENPPVLPKTVWTRANRELYLAKPYITTDLAIQPPPPAPCVAFLLPDGRAAYALTTQVWSWVCHTMVRYSSPPPVTCPSWARSLVSAITAPSPRELHALRLRFEQLRLRVTKLYSQEALQAALARGGDLPDVPGHPDASLPSLASYRACVQRAHEDPPDFSSSPLLFREVAVLSVFGEVHWADPDLVAWSARHNASVAKKPPEPKKHHK